VGAWACGVSRLGRGRVGSIRARLGLRARGQCRRTGQRGECTTPSHVGEHGDRSGMRGNRSGAPPGSVGDRLTGPGDGPIALGDVYIYITNHVLHEIK
jgi:hypothetical protein